MSRLYKEYMIETLNEDGSVKKVSFKKDEYYNFAYDVVDRLAAEKPKNWLWSGVMKPEMKSLLHLGK